MFLEVFAVWAFDSIESLWNQLELVLATVTEYQNRLKFAVYLFQQN